MHKQPHGSITNPIDESLNSMYDALFKIVLFCMTLFDSYPISVTLNYSFITVWQLSLEKRAIDPLGCRGSQAPCVQLVRACDDQEE